MNLLEGAAIAFGAVAAGCAIWGIGIERNLFTVREEPQTLAVLPKGAKKIRVLHISDFHLAPWQKRKQKFIASLAKLNVDLVVDTGDNLGHRDAIKPALAAMQGVLGIPGVFVNGSNDYFAPAPRNPFNYLFSPSKRESHEALATAEFIEGLETAGWLNLNNSTGTLSVNGSKLRFVGVDDHHEHLSKLETIGQNAKALKTGETLIGVTHAPYLAVINAMEDAGVQVLFAGHTHGGQVCIPGFGAIITNCDLPANAAKGLSSWSRTGRVMWLNVCAGLGHSIYAPVRFACKPEVRIIELVAAE